MASGRLGASDLAATTNTSVYTVPASKLATFNVSVCNRNATAVTVRLAVATAAAPVGAEYIEYDVTLQPKQAFERTGIMADAGKILVAYASAANVSVVAWGIEEAA